MQHIRLALGFVWRSSRRWTLWLLLFQLLQALLPLLSLYLIKLIVDDVTQAEQIDFSILLRYILGFGGVQLLMAVLQNYQQLISETQQQLVVDYMSTVIMDKAVSIDMSYYENAQYHDTFHRAQAQAMYRPVQILQNLTGLLRNGFLLLSLAGLLFWLHWSIGLVLLLVGLPLAAVRWYYARKLFDWEKQRTRLEREANYLNYVLTTEEHAKEVRLFDLAGSLKARFQRVREKLFQEKLQIGRQRARAGLLAKGAEISALIGVLLFVGWRTYRGQITAGDLVMYFQAFQRGQAAVQQLLQSVVGLYQNRLFLQHLFELLEMESTLTVPNDPMPLPRPLRSGIRLEQVRFRYPGTEKIVLEGINLELRKGQVTALVGENGSGKTTLVKLLGRLYDPEAGRILWDEVLIDQASLAELRRRVSVIYQDFAQYHFSVAENIAMGDLAQADPQGIKRAAQQSGAATFIEQLPADYAQQLGRWLGAGIELSGGQWQKIALARAFYKAADLIILDEPSSAIDPLAEAQIFRELRDIARDKVLVLVTHRLYNLRMADQIVVMDQGRVVATGTHDSLMAEGGLYRRMFEQQEQGY